MSSSESVLQNERVIHLVESEADRGAPMRAERTDNQLVDLVLAGDESAFEELFERHKRLVAMIAGRHFRRYEEIEEIVQTAFAKAYTQLHRFQGRYERSFPSWLVTITANTCLDTLRSQRRRPEQLNCELDQNEAEALYNFVASENEHTEKAVADSDLAEKLLAHISPEDRALLEMMYAEEMSVSDIAKAYGMSKSNVKIRAWRARLALRKVIDKFL